MACPNAPVDFYVRERVRVVVLLRRWYGTVRILFGVKLRNTPELEIFKKKRIRNRSITNRHYYSLTTLIQGHKNDSFLPPRDHTTGIFLPTDRHIKDPSDRLILEF